MASYIAQVNIGGTLYPVGSSLYGTCATEAATATKTATVNGFDTLTTGVTVFIKFTYANTSSTAAKLGINSTAAKEIHIKGKSTTSFDFSPWDANEIVAFTYDGTYWNLISGLDTNTEYSWMANSDVATNAFTDEDAKVISPKVLGTAINNKISALDVSSISGTGTGKTLKTLSETDGKIAATFQDISITKSQVSDLGTIGQAAAKNVDTIISDGSTSTNVPTSAAVVNYVESSVAGLTGAMHFIGVTSTQLEDGDTTASIYITDSTTGLDVETTPDAGDVVIYNNKEFVWTGSSWELLGDEGSYALKTSTTHVGSASSWNAGSATTLTKTDVSIPNVTSVGTAPALTKSNVSIPNVVSAGSATTASVASGTLTITNGSAPTLGNAISATRIDSWSAGAAPTLGTAISATHIDSYTAGSAPALTITATTVVKP